MKKGKLYSCNDFGLIVLCTNGIPTDVDCFCGVILKNTKTSNSLIFSVGNYMESFKKSYFIEHQGQVDLNNCSFKG